jgi:hypothetical protein
MGRPKFFGLVRAAAIILGCVGSLAVAGARAEPQTVYFASADGRTQLVGYLFAPQTAGRHAAVVMLHGRGDHIHPTSMRDARSSQRTIARPAMPRPSPSGTRHGAAIGPSTAISRYFPTVSDLETKGTVSHGSVTMTRTATT